MPTPASVHHARRALRNAAAHAVAAPSIHNTQPWHLRVRDDVLELELDPTRCLPVVDPEHRQALISCGCALFNARVALAASGDACVVERFPDGVGENLLARIRLVDDPGATVPTELADLAGATMLRRTNRTKFLPATVSGGILDRLAADAAAEGAVLIPVHHDDHRDALASLSRWADTVQNGDAAYRAELRRWTTTDPARLDGVPVGAVPHVDGDSGDEVPLRDFDTSGAGRLPARTESSRRAAILLLGTDDTGPRAWLRAGEALERVLLQITRFGYASSPLTQALEVPTAAAELQQALNLTFHPQFVLRLGRAAATPPTPRRPLAEVLREDD